jgi:hypothetical protein
MNTHSHRCLASTFVLVLVTSAALAVASRSAAQGTVPTVGPTADASEVTRATIVSIDGQDVFIDLGAADLRAEQTLTVYRSIVVRHPLTRAALRDRFAIGRLVVRQAGERLSLAQASGAPARPFAVGDIAEGPRAPRPVVAVAPAAPAAAKAGAPAPQPARDVADAGTAAAATTAAAPAVPTVDAETEELVRYWRATLGRSPEDRAGLYRAFLLRWPSTRHAAAVREEIAFLTRPRARPTEPAIPGAPDASGASKDEATVAWVSPLRHARAGEAVALAGVYDVRQPPHRVVVFVRQRGEPDYRAFAMRMDGRGHARVRIPAKYARTRGFDYFVEAVRLDGTPVPIAGTAKEPLQVEVFTRGDLPEPREPGTRVRFSTEFVSFDGSSDDDYFLINEGDFFHRLDLGILHGFRMGYGHFLGKGGKLDEEGRRIPDPDSAGFSYGFFEGEFSLARLFGLAGRITVGLGRPEDIAEREGLAGGFQLRARIGTATGTRLVLAGEVVPEIGQRAFLGLQWSLGERVPMSTEVHVTDQPVNSDELAVRLVHEIGYRFGDRFTLALRPSYQLRTIRHAGPGIGLAATFDW